MTANETAESLLREVLRLHDNTASHWANNLCDRIRAYLTTPQPVESEKVEVVEGWICSETGAILCQKWDSEHLTKESKQVAILRRADYGRLVTDVEKFKDQVHWTLRRAEKAEAERDALRARVAKLEAEVEADNRNVAALMDQVDEIAKERDALRARIDGAPVEDKP